MGRARFDKPDLVRSHNSVQPAGARELKGCDVSKLRHDCSYSGEQRCSHLRATHGLCVDSLPALVLPTLRRSELHIDAPDIDR